MGKKIPDEDPEEQDQFKNALFENFAPKDQAQKDLVWLIADGLWRLRRFSRIEAGVLTWHTYEFMRTRLEQKSGAAAQACAERSLSAKQAAIDDLQPVLFTLFNRLSARSHFRGLSRPPA